MTMTPAKLDQIMHAHLGQLTEEEFAEWRRPSVQTLRLRAVDDAEFLQRLSGIAGADEAWTEFDDADLLRYSAEYEDGTVINMITKTLAHCFDRLDKRDKRQPHADDPVGRALAKESKTRRGTRPAQ